VHTCCAELPLCTAPCVPHCLYARPRVHQITRLHQIIVAEYIRIVIVILEIIITKILIALIIIVYIQTHTGPCKDTV
jgi:hypothetical protein